MTTLTDKWWVDRRQLQFLDASLLLCDFDFDLKSFFTTWFWFRFQIIFKMILPNTGHLYSLITQHLTSGLLASRQLSQCLEPVGLVYNPACWVTYIQQELGYRKQIARQDIYRLNYPVTWKSKALEVTGNGNHWIDITRLTSSRVIWRRILSWPWNVS